MLYFAIFCALAIVSIAGALLFQAGRVKARHRRFVGEKLPPLEVEGVRLVDQPRALYHGTHFADGAALLVPVWRDACVCDLFCTEQAIFLQREQPDSQLLAIPLPWIVEAALHREFAPLAEKELPMLRLRWRRGGQLLETDLSLRGGMANLETLRREIHLRQANVAEQLKPLLEPVPK